MPVFPEEIDMGSVNEKRESRWNSVYRLVRRIPPGRVMTYGQIALILEPLSARAVGWAMHNCPEGVPWHRVVNSRGGCSTERLPNLPPGLQQSLLEREGVSFDQQGRLRLEECRWFPRDQDLEEILEENERPE